MKAKFGSVLWHNSSMEFNCVVNKNYELQTTIYELTSHFYELRTTIYELTLRSSPNYELIYELRTTN